MNILLVDDSRAMRMIVRRALRDAGFGEHTITEAEDGSKALSAIKANAPDVVMADWNMPNMSGIELLETLNAQGIETTFGFVTTEKSTAARERATDAGANFMISAPFTAEAFRTALEPILRP